MRNFTLLLFLISGLIYSQNTLRFFYEVNFKRDALGDYPAKDIVVLEINKDSNIFLSNDYLVTDSINTVHKDNQGFADPNFVQVVEYNKSDDSFDFINVLSSKYYQFNSKRKIKWMISDEKKKIGTFEVTKATAEYGGRNWTAWFAPDIPFPYGPYVFYGLPGLILDISDDQENYHFSFIQNKSYKTELNSEQIIKKVFSDSKVNIKEKDWGKIQLNYYKNPISNYKNGESYMVKDSGEKYTQNDYRDYEKALQNQIQKLNNPIELSEKVDYK